MIFGKRGFVYRLLLVHFAQTFSLSYFLRLIATAIGSYSRSQRAAQTRSASTGSRMLRRIYGHIVAQGLGAEKLTSSLDGPGGPIVPRRYLSAVSQVGMASVIVLMAWLYWPGEAAAPAVASAGMQPVVAQALAPSPSLALAPDSPNRTADALFPAVDASSQQIAETRERFSTLAPQNVIQNDTQNGTEPKRQIATQSFGSESDGATTRPTVSPEETGKGSNAAKADAVLGPSRPGGLSGLLTSLAEVAARQRDNAGQIIDNLATGNEGKVVVEAQPTSTPQPVPTPGPVPVLVPGPQWSDFTPAAAPAVDHFWLGQPHPSGYNQFYSPNYQFGSTANARYRIHHGVDIASDGGTPVLAMGEGEVVHAGPDNPVLLGPYNNFYGNAVVVRLNRRLSTPEGDQDVFVLLAHLSEVYVERGQQVTPDVVVGAVGMTGIAIGPHLHVEVRVGQNSYLDSVNPALWMQNPSGTGSVAARLLTADGRSWSDARLSLLRYEGGTTRWVRTIEIYPDAEGIGADPAWGENGALSQLAAGAYWIGGVVNGEKFGQNITIYPGETTFVELRTQQ